MRIATDRRCIEAERDDPCEADLAALGAPLRGLQIKAAQALARLDERRHHMTKGSASIAQLSRRLGYGFSESRQLAAMGYSLHRAPELEAHVRSGHVAVEAAAELARIFKKPQLNPPIDPHAPEAIAARAPWIEMAATKTLKALRRIVRKRLAQLDNANTPMVEVTLVVKEATLSHFRRARIMVSRRKKKSVTEGETLEYLLHYFLRQEDPLYRDLCSGKIRAPDTKRHGLPATRYISVAVQCDVRTRADDMCEALGCDHDVWLQFAHVTPFAQGGDSSAENLLLLCTRHHVMFDAGAYVAFDPAQEHEQRGHEQRGHQQGGHQEGGHERCDPHAPPLDGHWTHSLRRPPKDGWGSESEWQLVDNREPLPNTISTAAPPG